MGTTATGEPGCRPDQYNGKYLAAIWDRTGEADPPYVKVKKTYFKWREVKTFKEVDDDSVISKFYDEEANRLKCSDPAAVTADLETNRSWFPKLPMIPVKVVIKVMKKPTTAWELLHHQCNCEDDKDATV